MTQASYINLYKSGELEKRVKKAYKILQDCVLCPHHCHVDRTNGEIGYCNIQDEIKVASFGAHFGEEDPLVGAHGSGTIFFKGCNLRCVYCQNYDISHIPSGDPINSMRLAEIMLSLQQQGCHNINFVTPSHMIHALLAATLKAAKKGLQIPLVYNSGGYDDLKALQLLDGVVDIYMPDVKYADEQIGLKYSKVKNYLAIVKDALKEMHQQVGNLQIKDGIATQGLIIRHLVLPQNLAGTKKVINFISQELSPDTYVNIMKQYYPAYKAKEYEKLNRHITSEEFNHALKIAEDAGLKPIY